MLLVMWLIALTTYKGNNMHVNLPYLSIRHFLYVAWMPNFLGIFASGTYLAVTCEVDGAFGYVLVYICRIVGSVFHFSMFFLCELYIQCGSHISSVIYVKYV